VCGINELCATVSSLRILGREYHGYGTLREERGQHEWEIYSDTRMIQSEADETWASLSGYV